MFSCEFCKIFKNIIFTEHIQVAASKSDSKTSNSGIMLWPKTTLNVEYNRNTNGFENSNENMEIGLIKD